MATPNCEITENCGVRPDPDYPNKFEKWQGLRGKVQLMVKINGSGPMAAPPGFVIPACFLPDVVANPNGVTLAQVNTAITNALANLPAPFALPPVPAGACQSATQQLALASNGAWAPIAAKRTVVANASGGLVPAQTSVFYALAGAATLNPPASCNATSVTLKNTTTAPVAVTGNFDGVAGTIITIPGTNVIGTAAGGSFDAEWDATANTYWVH